MSGPSLRPLTADDLDWVSDLARRRRTALEPHAPRFWRPAADAHRRHRTFLAHLIEDDATIGLRTGRGFLLALHREGSRFVDDMAMDGDDAWVSDGVALLRELLASTPRVRLSAPVPEEARQAAASEVGMVRRECWWHRDLRPFPQLMPAEHTGRLDVAGARAELVPAPPVYDPGGPVLLVSGILADAAVTDAEREAERRGAAVAVVSTHAGDDRYDRLLTDAGYRRTTWFYESTEAGR